MPALAAASATGVRRRNGSPTPRRRRTRRRGPPSRRSAPAPAPLRRRRTDRCTPAPWPCWPRPCGPAAPCRRRRATKPARISVAPNRTLSPLTRQSAASARPRPAPSAYPVIAATVGFGIAATASTAARCTRIQLSASDAVSVRSWGMSSPAEKISWPPKRMTAAMSSRSADLGGGLLDLPIDLPGHGVGGRPRQHQSPDARMVCAQVDADELAQCRHPSPPALRAR